MEIIQNNKKSIIALIVRKDFKKNGINFFTPESFSQQVAQITHPKNKLISCHYHNDIKRKTTNTQEVLIIKKGKIKVFLFDKKKYLCSKILNNGDLILLASGGHGFKILKKTTFIEVKQGPYVEKKDKVIFKSRFLK